MWYRSQPSSAGSPADKFCCLLQIRFTRFGRKKVPFYRIIAIDSRERRDGLPIEVSGVLPAGALPDLGKGV